MSRSHTDVMMVMGEDGEKEKDTQPMDSNEQCRVSCNPCQTGIQQDGQCCLVFVYEKETRLCHRYLSDWDTCGMVITTLRNTAADITTGFPADQCVISYYKFEWETDEQKRKSEY